MDKLISSPELDPTTIELQEFWRQVGKNLVNDSISSLDEAARQIITITGILVGLYVNAIAFSNLHGALIDNKSLFIYLSPIILFLLSLISGLLVFFPDRFKLNITSWDACKKTYESTARSKLLLIRIASLTLIIGVISILIAVGYYLG